MYDFEIICSAFTPSRKIYFSHNRICFHDNRTPSIHLKKGFDCERMFANHKHIPSITERVLVIIERVEITKQQAQLTLTGILITTECARIAIECALVTIKHVLATIERSTVTSLCVSIDVSNHSTRSNDQRVSISIGCLSTV